MSRVIWSRTAIAQLVAIKAYLEQFNPRAAEKLAAKLLAAGNSLANFPYRGRAVRGTSMRELLTVPNHIIRYELIRDEVQVLRIRHCARRPTRP